MCEELSKVEITTLDAIKGHDRLTLKELRRLVEVFKDAPEDTPVLYQRIAESYFTTPGNGWEVVMLPWESTPWSEKQEKSLIEAGVDFFISEKGEDKLIVFTDEYIPAFGIYRTEDKDGNAAICIHAHF